MILERIVTFDRDVLCAKRKTIANDDEPAWMFWASHEFCGILLVNNTGETNGPEGLYSLDPDLLEDGRLVGPAGEWHVWRTNDDSMSGRTRISPQPEQENVIIENHFLWGTDFCCKNSNNTGWSCLTEERGMLIWVPWEVSLPASLRFAHFIDFDPHTGLAGIVDSMLLMPDECVLEKSRNE